MNNKNRVNTNVFARFNVNKIICLIILMTLTTISHLSRAKSSPQFNENLSEQQQLARHVQSLNELTERRRTNRLFQNEQTPLNGQRIYYTNVGGGNTSFVMRDIVLLHRLPITFARVYDSNAGVGDFGQGWRLNYNESITPLANGNLHYQDESGSEHLIVKQGAYTYQARYHFAQIKNVTFKTNNQITLTLSDGSSKIFSAYNGAFKLVEIKDPHGNSVNIHYNQGVLEQVSNQHGDYINISRNNNGFISKITDNHLRSIQFNYKNGLLNTSQDLAGNLWHYSYQKQQLTKITDPENNQVVKFKYYQQGPHQGKTKTAYIGKQSFEFQYQGNITTLTNHLQLQNQFEQNEQGVTVAIINSQGQESRIELNDDLQVIELFENGITTAELIYGSNKKPNTIIKQGKSYTLNYHNKQLHSIVDAIASINPKGQPLLHQSNGAIASINSNGKPLSLTANNITRHYQYNSKGDVIEQREEITGSKDIISHYQYNNRGLLTALTVKGEQATFDYNTLGQLSQITFPNGAFHRYTYNALGFRAKTTRSDGSHIDYTYDKTGNLLTLSQTDGKGNQQLKEMHLDGDNLTQEYIVDGKMMLDIQYDQTDNPVSIAYNGKAVSYQYDSHNRLTKVIDDDQELHYHYQNGESDIRLQQDERSFISRLSKGRSSHNSLNINHLYARTIGTPHRYVYFDPYQNRFKLPSFEQILATDINHDAGQRRRLYNAVAKQRKTQREFDKPSNSIFTPPVYRAINCEADFCWELVEVILSGPSSATIGQTVTFTADHFMGNMYDEFGSCNVRNRFSVDGNIITYTSSNTFNYIFGSAGSKEVEVRSDCQNCATWNFQYHSIFTDVLANKCNVDFELSGTGDYRITSGPTMPTITATVTHLYPPEANIEWSAQIKHSRVGSCAGKTQFDSSVLTGYGSDFTPNWQDQLFGGDLIIKATCTAYGYDSYAKTKTKKVLGTEPSNVTKGVYIGLATSPFEVADLRKIACLESSFKQFSQSTGLPTYGPGGDAGLGQICFRQTSQHQWDWRANLDYAEEILTGDSLRGAKSYLDSLVDIGATPYTDDMLRKEAIHRYNAGCCGGANNAYWGWVGGRWGVVDTGGVGGYVTHVTNKGDLCTY